MTVTIDSGTLSEIKSALGHPIAELIEWDDTYIQTSVLSRVVRNYFTYYPLIWEKDYKINRNFDIAYPNDTTIFRVFRHYFNYKGTSVVSDNPFVLQQMITFQGSHFDNFSYPALDESINRISTAESVSDYSRSVVVQDRPNQRKVFGYTNTPGTLYIQFAKYSTDFSDIQWNHLDDAIQLAKAYLLQDSSRIRSQISLQSKADINTDQLRSDGDRIEEEIMRKWKRNIYPTVIPS